MIEVEFVDIVPQPTAFSAIVPGLGFLRDVMTTPFVVHWKIRDGWATAAELPGVRIPGASFMGISATGAVGAEAQGMDRARAARARCRRLRVAARVQAGAVPGGRCGLRRLAHAAAARERRQFRRQATDQGRQAVAAGFRQGRAVLDRRRRISPKATARSASPRSRWARPSWSASKCTRVSPPSEHSPARSSRTRLFPDPKIRRAAEFPRRDGHADQRQGRDREREISRSPRATPCST